ncbi:MAG: LuxR C-terminal-related transcriptional regulator [Bacteroidota bacterium]
MSITAKEHHILASLSAGLTSKQIATLIGIDEPSVNRVITKLMKEFRAKNRTHLAVKYQQSR